MSTPARQGEATKPVKVAFVGGYSRSGSTLLDCLLGQLPGFFSTGELAYIWTHGLQENRLCGCGAQFLDCPFWTDVGNRAFGGWRSVDVKEMVALERTMNRHRFVPLLLRPELSPSFARNVARYTDVLGALYRCIRDSANARVIVDSTIDPAYGFVLRHVPGMDLRLVHMIRDSRATAFSWTRWQLRTDRVDTVMYQRRFRPPMTAVRWSLYHTLIHLLSAVGPREIRVRYEDVVVSPQRELRRIAAHLDEAINDDDLAFVQGDEVELETNHTVAGSLMRLKRGPLPLRLDDEWVTALRPLDRRLVTILSGPFLGGYGYLRERP